MDVLDLMERKVDIFLDNIAETILGKFLSIVDALIAVLCIAAIGYIVFYCVKMMFFQNGNDMQRALFGYFIFLLLRIFSALIKVATI